MSAAVIVVSDTCSGDPSKDSVGPLLVAAIRENGFSVEISHVADERPRIADVVTALAAEHNLVVTTGGTGLGKRDVTPEAVQPLFTKAAPGIAHSMLAYGLNKTPLAALGRPTAGLIGETLVLCVPGSRNGALESWEAVARVVGHVLDVRALGRGAHEVAGLEHSEQKHSHSTQSCKHGHSHSHGHTAPIFYGPAHRHRSSPYPMISVEEAQRIVFETPFALTSTTVPLAKSTGYVTAEVITSQLNVPPFVASIVDGYAVLHSDCPGTFPVAHVSLAAGEIHSIERNTCVRVTTGAPVPHGATAVVPVENTSVKAEKDGEEVEVEVAANPKSGDNIRKIGSDMALGEAAMANGTLITSLGGEIGTLASLGLSKVLVHSKPVVGVLSTGDEVVEPGTSCAGSQIWDSNRPMLIACLESHGFEVVDLGIARDSREILEERILRAADKCDVLITSGGVSMGEMDLLKPTIESLGGNIKFGRVAMKPGKPMTFATLEKLLVFALPGNPASVSVCFHLFVLPLLKCRSGRKDYMPPRVPVQIDFDARLDPRPEFHRVNARPTPEGWVASSTGFQRSSRVASMANANALLCLPASETGETLPQGTLVDALLIGDL